MHAEVNSQYYMNTEYSVPRCPFRYSAFANPGHIVMSTYSQMASNKEIHTGIFTALVNLKKDGINLFIQSSLSCTQGFLFIRAKPIENFLT